jgi:hypothetical protein
MVSTSEFCVGKTILHTDNGELQIKANSKNFQGGNAPSRGEFIHEL